MIYEFCVSFIFAVGASGTNAPRYVVILLSVDPDRPSYAESGEVRSYRGDRVGTGLGRTGWGIPGLGNCGVLPHFRLTF
jgi:hypothetical protein